MRAEITSIPFTRNGEQVELSLKLDSLESTLLVFSATKRDLPLLIETGDIQPVEVINAIPMQTSNPTVAPDTDILGPLAGCDWVWQAGENATVSVAPGCWYFRGSFDISPDNQVSKARFIGTADNEMELYINGKRIADENSAFAEWKKLTDVDVTGTIVKGHNTIAISVLNTTDKASPAGLIGKCELVFADGLVRTVMIDPAWKVSNQKVAGWEKSDFNDSQWSHAVAFASFGAGPWGTLTNQSLTVSPVKKADPFVGYLELSAEQMQRKIRFILDMGEIKPEQAARITINNAYVGGCIGRPSNKDITEYLKPGRNIIRIEPFSPDMVQIFFLPY